VAAVNQTKVEYIIISYFYDGCPQNESKTNIYTRDCLLIKETVTLIVFFRHLSASNTVLSFFLEMFTKDTLLQAIRFSIL
jgi:hypothetical protein